MRVALRLVRGARANETVALEDNQSVILGRGTESNFRIQDPSISRRHCQISNTPRGLLIADLGSSNGTYVNQQRLAPGWAALSPGDQVIFGQNELRVLTPQQMMMGAQLPQAGMQQQPGLPMQQPMAMQQPMQQPQAMAMQGGGDPRQSHGSQQMNMAALGRSSPDAAVNSYRCGHCSRPITQQEIAQNRYRQDTNGRLICADCLKHFDFDPNMVDGYQIQKKLGQGAFGAVFKALQLKDQKIVALKTIKPQLVSSERDVQRFFREAETGGKLVHPSITAVYNAGESKGTHFIAMEYIDGREVSKLIEEYGRLDVGYAMRVTIQISSALQHAYEKGIVHRDIKPENIMVSKDGVAKLVDFGLAKSFTQAGQSGLTAPGEGMGTLAYMPPEQLDNALNADQRSDIYSLGATLYHMLTGQRPFNEKTTRSFIMKILNAMPAPIRTLNPQVPQELEDIISRAMAKKPEDRYQKAGDMEADLRNLFQKLAAQHAAGRSSGG
jgi:predicted Ser/Thr protein kinase